MLKCKCCCVVCTRTLYSCHSGRAVETHKSKQKACCWFSIVVFVAALALSWMYICLVSYNDQEDVNWKGFAALQLWVNWFMVLIILSALLTAYCVLLLLFALIQIALKEPLNLHWVHKIFLCCGVVFIGAGVAGISHMWKQEWLTVQLSLEATAPFLQFGAVGALTLLCKLVFQAIFSAEQKSSRCFIGVTFVMMSIAIFLCPLCIQSPCFIEKDQLPSKPKLIGHRGAPMLSPENTMMSFTRSISCGVTAFETDVQLRCTQHFVHLFTVYCKLSFSKCVIISILLHSMDRVPFLMHDHNSNFLLRTTNAKDKFPDKDLSKSDRLSWTEYQTLNAGEWFVKTDPFGTVSQLSKDEKALVQNQTIPSLLQLLHLAQQHNISVMFDLYSPNQENDTVDTVDTILDSGIDPHLVLWLPPAEKNYVRARAPKFTQVYNNVEEMNRRGGKILNLKYSKISTTEIRELRKSDLEVNLWVVNERWLFSLLWCAGASSVTTNACHVLKEVESPDWILSRQLYLIIWLTVDTASVLVMAALFVYQWDENRKKLMQLERERSVPLLTNKPIA